LVFDLVCGTIAIFGEFIGLFEAVVTFLEHFSLGFSQIHQFVDSLVIGSNVEFRVEDADWYPRYDCTH